ncbi:chorismate synthase, partial [Escherichia coli]
MAGNTYGNRFRVTTFGESHGVAIGGIIDGCPAGIELDLEQIQLELDRRKPGQSKIVTQRKEADEVKFLSGIFEGKTTGTPIGFVIENTNSKSKDYDHIKDIYRPSHADYVYDEKYGHRDHRGGGRSSARETASRVVAGAIAKQVLKEIKITAYVSSVGDIAVEKKYSELDFNEIENNPVRCADPIKAVEMETLIKEVKKDGDSIGGTIICVVQNVPVGLGEPVFDRLDADLAKAMLGI